MDFCRAWVVIFGLVASLLLYEVSDVRGDWELGLLIFKSESIAWWFMASRARWVP